uniref:Uncharacterized protein n=1 Tax=Rhizophora mucronata TaxID=61149 RepID=A0A2P2J7Q9_RHIMU
MADGDSPQQKIPQNVHNQVKENRPCWLFCMGKLLKILCFVSFLKFNCLLSPF